MKILILAALLLNLVVGCGQTGPLRPGPPNPPAAETAK
jgi:predicted small lipoprotein YifL